ncbi:hypothetical protein BCR37DRAFT_153415 [Protomyces lactucae-debilis]|uniref:Uncharacterized protein n=1 Tax=Protomyces lactucae-debilis TaxID=2754530 RepID=A0A1Y2F0E2_PROLT|nr:uncharacterized protein BCR37DRAFT_153415 [Protomyces lactucae-debilis]ORY77352.1 hypothetical protein BCR37DRAFT_153415 [Protomyces lactucae-debilis]
MEDDAYDFGSQDIHGSDLYGLDDALSDNELDSLFAAQGLLEETADLQEPQAVALDPFTAAQQEERTLQRQQSALSQGHLSPDQVDNADADANDEDDQDLLDGSFAFTQKLLTNAKTLRELQASGAPSLEIAYEADTKEPIKPSSTATVRASQTRSASQRTRHRPSQPDRMSQQQSVYPYTPLTESQFASMPTLADDALWQGRFESIPVRALQELSFLRAKQVLHATRVYKQSATTMSFSTCLRDLFNAHTLLAMPVFQVCGQRGTSLLLKDAHDDPCTVLAHALYTGLEADSITDAVQLSHFFFDHAVGFGATRSTASAAVDASGSSGNGGGLPAPGQAHARVHTSSQPFSEDDGASDTVILDGLQPSAVMMIVAAKRVLYHACKAEMEAIELGKRQAASVFEQARQDSEADVVVARPSETQETDYGEDLGDFPVEFVDE